MIIIDEFISQMVSFFPGIGDELYERMKDGFEGIDTIIIEDIIMPRVIALIEKNSDEEKLKMVFSYFEDVCTKSDDYLKNVFSITVLEILGNEKETLEKAKKYMGPRTTEMQREADLGLGRKV